MTVQAINLVKASRADPAVADMASASNATAGDYFVNDGQTFLMVKNGDGSPHSVTVAFQSPGAAVDGQTPSNVAHAVPAGHTVLIGPFPTAFYNDANGRGQLSYSATTSMTILAVQCPPAG